MLGDLPECLAGIYFVPGLPLCHVKDVPTHMFGTILATTDSGSGSGKHLEVWSPATLLTVVQVFPQSEH